MWRQTKNHLVRSFEFNSFAKAVEFINAIGLLQAEAEHIPFWEEKLHMVIVRVSTSHDISTIDEKEKKIIGDIEEIYIHI